MSWKIVVLVLFTVGLLFVGKLWTVGVGPEVETDIALRQLENPSISTSTSQRWLASSQPTLFLVWLVGTLCLFGKEIWIGFKKMKTNLLAAVLIAVTLSVTNGCSMFMKPYHEAVLVDVDTSETPFLIELENDNEQATLSTEESLRKKLVVSRRIEIPHRWKPQGREILFYNGEWIPSARIICVDKQPVTREWVKTAQKDDAIWVESNDSVGYSTGFNITARIATDDDAVKFLHNYPPRGKRIVKTKTGEFTVHVIQLEDIIDQEIRARVQKVYADLAAAHDMDVLRTKKVELMEAVRADIVPFFKKKGITIPTIGQFGGFEYENKLNQLAIDKVFQEQQDKVVAKAEADAAEVRKLALKRVGEGEGDRIFEKKFREAKGIRAIADAKAYEIEKAKADLDTYLALKRLEIERKKLEAWDGKYPAYLFQGASSSNMLLELPGPQASK